MNVCDDKANSAGREMQNFTGGRWSATHAGMANARTLRWALLVLLVATVPADLVLLDANPLDNIRNTQRINAVVLRGKLLNRKNLAALLSRAAELALNN